MSHFAESYPLLRLLMCQLLQSAGITHWSLSQWLCLCLKPNSCPLNAQHSSKTHWRYCSFGRFSCLAFICLHFLSLRKHMFMHPLLPPRLHSVKIDGGRWLHRKGLGTDTMLFVTQQHFTILSYVFRFDHSSDLYAWIGFSFRFSAFSELLKHFGCVFPNSCISSNKSVSGCFCLGLKHCGGNKPYIHVSYNWLIDVNAC